MANQAEETFPFRVAARYEVTELLGRGGMASVYRARDEVLETAVALKLLKVAPDDKHAARTVELFEREFHTLVQLSHPRVVRALDYGVEGQQPYYSMELLDGGDLRELAPLPWRDVCTIAYEMCSALSLLHSRRLVHRDLTPRNIRKTQSGKAKLIDFGLLSPMGPTTLIAGTPPFAPPELVRAMSLDGRSDLFSLGATLYYALTRRQPYPARSFDQLPDAWRGSPPRPSSLIADVPRALDELLLGMLRIDIGSRPKSAAEVMERLVPLLSSPPGGELRAARAYLVTPKLVGRDQVVARFRKQMMRAVRGHGGGFAVVGEEGTGRSRMLDAFVLEAKLLGATAVRAGREDATRPFGVAASLARQIHCAAPAVAHAAAAAHPAVRAILYPDESSAGRSAARLADVTQSARDRAEVQAALRTWILEFSSRRPLAIAIDDLDRIDEPSAALLASVTWESTSRRLMYLAVLPPEGAARPGGAVEVVREHAETVRLEPLSTEQVTALFASLFGDAPNLGVLSARFTALSAGRPRECMMFAQYLLEAGAITYAGGSWTLPAELPDTLLPANLEQAFALRVAKLGPLARHMAALLAENLLEKLSRIDLLALALAPAAAVDAAIAELAGASLVIGDSSGYVLTGAAIARLMSSSLDEDERRRINDELATLHERAGRHTLLVAYHALAGSRGEEAVAWISRQTPNTDERSVFFLNAVEVLGESRAALAVDRAERAAARMGRAPFELQSLRAMLGGASARGADPAYFYRIAPDWLARAKHDSGYDDWQRLDPTLDPSARAMMALGAAIQRHRATPETQRGQSPQEGIQQLVAYVLFSIAISTRVLDRDLVRSLPELLVPFAPLNPMVAAVLANARATCMHSAGRREDARAAFSEVLQQLESVSGAELRYVDSVRAAVCFAHAAIDITLGVQSPWLSRYVELQDRNHRVTALFLQKILALQQGEWELAERYRQEAELLSLQTSESSMFPTIGDEIEAISMARDLTGVRHAREKARAMAARFPGWMPMLKFADAQYLRLCGDLERAFATISPALDGRDDDQLPATWITAGRVLAVELLVELDRAEEASSLGLSELARCESHGMRSQARQLSLSIARAEAKLGRFDTAWRRVEAVLAEQLALGIAGLQLGHTYEVAARIAIAEQKADDFRTYAALARERYKPGKSSVLGALYERLVDEARQAGLTQVAPLASSVRATDAMSRASEDVTTLLAGCNDARERAELALGLLCDGDPPTRGHLLIAKNEGLLLVASNTACTSVSEIVAFASERMDRESRAGSMETNASEADTIGTPSTEWRDHEGVDYEVVLLVTSVSSGFCIAGVALLAKSGPPRAGNMGPLADAIARALITSGDAIAVDAA
jgi:hypothetical protein